MGLNHSHSAANEIYTTFLHYIILNSRLWLKLQAETAGQTSPQWARIRERLHVALLDAMQKRLCHATGISIAKQFA
jgi:hypothetical protein